MNPEDYTKEQQEQAESRVYQYKVLKHFMTALNDSRDLFTITDAEGKEEIFSPADIYEAISVTFGGKL